VQESNSGGMADMTPTDLNAIARRLEAQKSMRPESWDAWCLHAVSDVAALLAHVRALEAERARLREALESIVTHYDTLAEHYTHDADLAAGLVRLARAALDPNRSE
jgi:hypothetical protein